MEPHPPRVGKSNGTRAPPHGGRLPTIDRQPAFGHVVHLATSNADAIGERLLGVPFHPGLSDEAVGEIAAALASAFG